MAPARIFSPNAFETEQTHSNFVTRGSDSVRREDLENLSSDLRELRLLESPAVAVENLAGEHELLTAPILTRAAQQNVRSISDDSQYGLLGSVLSIHSKEKTTIPDDRRLYVNTNTPFSAIVCGVQGSGKSHTVSVLLENMFIPDLPDIGLLKKPLSGLVLHFGEGGPSARPSEASFVGLSDFPDAEAPNVKVYVSHSSLRTMRTVYSCLGDNVTVEPLLFDESELDAEAFLSMMAVGSSEAAPLYIQVVLSILRELGEVFTYDKFARKLEEKKKDFNPAQRAGLEQRLALLNTFIAAKKSRSASSWERAPRFKEGQLTVIDLSDPFIDAASACGLFEVIVRLFVRADVGTGKVLVLDEAHKYLSSSASTTGLTKSLLTLIREQRHLGMRVLISTQEPTVVPPVLLDLCTIAILHRFSSPSWWDHLVHHVSAELSAEGGFDKAVKLKTGEAIVLAPTGIFVDLTASDAGVVSPIARRYLVMKTRKRITADGGASVMVL